MVLNTLMSQAHTCTHPYTHNHTFNICTANDNINMSHLVQMSASLIHQNFSPVTTEFSTGMNVWTSSSTPMMGSVKSFESKCGSLHSYSWWSALHWHSSGLLIGQTSHAWCSKLPCAQMMSKCFHITHVIDSGVSVFMHTFLDLHHIFIHFTHG